LSNIIEATPACIKTITKDGKLLSMNSTGLKMIEMTDVESVIGQNVYDFIDPQHKEEFIELNKIVCNGNKGSLEYIVIGAKGSRLWLQPHAVPVEIEGGEIAHLAFTQDITSRKASERELDNQKEKLINNTKMAALGQMASGIAHKINNPLTIISASANALKRRLRKNDLDEGVLEKALEKIEMTSLRIAKIIQGLKSISRNADNDLMEKISLKEVLEDVETLSIEMFKSKGVDLSISNLDNDLYFFGRKT
jgi:PAS domain S-box-containing protein